MIKAFFVVIDICIMFIGCYCVTNDNIRIAGLCIGLLCGFAINHHLGD
jgi:hypothetical protein